MNLVARVDDTVEQIRRAFGNKERITEPVHEIMVLITQVTSEDSSELVQSRQSLRCLHT